MHIRMSVFPFRELLQTAMFVKRQGPLVKLRLCRDSQRITTATHHYEHPV